jgi:predicted SAM-dependent methyltransferase
MEKFRVEQRGDRYVLLIEMDAFHEQVLPAFPSYGDPIPSACLDYRNPNNVVGHQQRKLLVEYGLKAFTETGRIGIDIGSAGVISPACISLDHIGTGETPAYGGTYDGVNIKADAEKLENFGVGSYGCVLTNHVAEHLSCHYYFTNQQQRVTAACEGMEIIPILQRWVDLICPGGYFVGITPDNKFAEEVGSSTLFYDETHKHQFDSRTFKGLILDKLNGIELIQYDEFQNNFSFEWVAKKI